MSKRALLVGTYAHHPIIARALDPNATIERTFHAGLGLMMLAQGRYDLVFVTDKLDAGNMARTMQPPMSGYVGVMAEFISQARQLRGYKQKPIVAIGVEPHNEEIALKSGATFYLNASTENPEDLAQLLQERIAEYTRNTAQKRT
jgi:CheY-like chemotaxis protein